MKVEEVRASEGVPLPPDKEGRDLDPCQVLDPESFGRIRRVERIPIGDHRRHRKTFGRQHGSHPTPIDRPARTGGVPVGPDTVSNTAR